MNSAKKMLWQFVFKLFKAFGNDVPLLVITSVILFFSGLVKFQVVLYVAPKKSINTPVLLRLNFSASESPLNVFEDPLAYNSPLFHYFLQFLFI